MPTDFPRARAQARQLRRTLLQMVGQQASAPTQIATVADVSSLLVSGLVLATTNKGPIQVSGVPPYTVCPGTQIYVRQLGIKSIYIYDGLAGSYTNRITTSGSIQALTGAAPVASTGMVSSTGTITSAQAIAFSASPHFYLSFMFSVSGLPNPSGHSTLLDLPFLNAGNTAVAGNLEIDYLPTGQLAINTTNWNGLSFHDTTTEYFAPRRTWWFYMLWGVGLAINGIQPPSSTSFDFFSNSNSQTMLAGNYGVFALGDHTYNNAAPTGSWISKISLGYASSATLPTTMLSSDAQVPQDMVCWLCTNGDTSTTGTYPQLAQIANAGQYISTGPY